MNLRVYFVRGDGAYGFSGTAHDIQSEEDFIEVSNASLEAFGIQLAGSAGWLQVIPWHRISRVTSR